MQISLKSVSAVISTGMLHFKTSAMIKAVRAEEIRKCPGRAREYALPFNMRGTEFLANSAELLLCPIQPSVNQQPQERTQVYETHKVRLPH